MLELYLPYLMALMAGMELPADEVAVNQLPQANEDVRAAEEDVLVGGREPEEQVVTGQYLNALEVRPILTMTQQQWAAISAEGGNDLLYFTNLLAWRCGLWEIRYGINGEPATNVLPMEECHVDTASPGAFTDMVNFPPFVVYPQDSIQTLRIEVTYDDGTEDFVEVDRTRIVLP